MNPEVVRLRTAHMIAMTRTARRLALGQARARLGHEIAPAGETGWYTTAAFSVPIQ